MKKFLAVIMALTLCLTLGATAFASSEEPAVITSVAYAEKDANYVDSSLYSQVETVTYSDGSTQTIDVDAQTFILVIDGTIVELTDPANWTADAELYVIDKGNYDEVLMSMNTANWGKFYFTGAIDMEDGVYQEARSIPAATTGTTITDDSITGGEINIDADYISGIYVYNEDGAKVDISDVTLTSSGMGGNDFGTNGGWGTVISVSGSASAEIRDVVVDTEGPLHDGIWAGGTSVVDVYDTAVIASAQTEAFGYEPYTYDTFIIADAPLTDEEIAEYGISGEYYAEDYESMFGSGTHYYYYNDNATNNFSAPMLQTVPLALGLYGNIRGCICYGQATLSFYDSFAISDEWAVLSTDSGSGVLNATDTVAVIGELCDADEAEVTAEVNGVAYNARVFAAGEGSGYITYCDGFDDNFYGCSFYAPDYIAILTGGTFDFCASDNNRGYGYSDRIGFMSHGSAYTMYVSESDFDVSDTFYTVKSTGAVDITLDDVTVNLFGQDAYSGVLFQFMDNDDTGTDANDLEMDIVDLTYDDYMAVEPAASDASSEPVVKTVTIMNSDLAGDIYNSVGSSNNASTLTTYDGSTNLLSSWSANTVAITLDNSTLTGAISTSYAQHCDAEGNVIGGQFFFNKNATPMDGTAENTYDYLTSGRLLNTPAYNGYSNITVTLTNGAVWNVTGTSIIGDLEVGDGCTVNGVITENEDGTLTVSPVEGASEESAAEDAAEGGDWDAYIAYLTELVESDTTLDIYQQLMNELAEVEQSDYTGMEDGTMFGAIAHLYEAVSFEDFVG